MKTRYFVPWGYREQVYYSLMFSPAIYSVIPWYDWFQSLSSLVSSQFPFSLARPGDVVVQVGCNRLNAEQQGSSQSMLLAQMVGPTGHVVVVESEAINCEGMKRAHDRANLPWVTFLNCAASDSPGMLSGLDVNGHSYFYDPGLGTEDVRRTSREACPDLKRIWDEIEATGRKVSLRADRLDTLLRSIDRVPKFINMTINGYEPAAIRGLGDFLGGDLILAFQARAAEAFWETGILDELEERGYVLVMSNTLHSRDYRWFPYITAMRPEHLELIVPKPIAGRFDIEPREKCVTFIGDQGERPIVPA